MKSDQSTTRVESLCEGIIEACWLLALGVVPLLVNIYSQRTYEPDKAAMVRSLAVLIVAAWLCKAASGGRMAVPAWLRKTNSERRDAERRGMRLTPAIPLLLLTLAFGVLVVVGSLLSVDPRLSWLGSYARAQGAITELAYLVFFAAVVGHFRTWSQWRRVVQVVVATGTVVSLFAIFQKLGLDPVETVESTRRVYSTLGNAIFLGAYLLMTFFVTAFELISEILRGNQRGHPSRAQARASRAPVVRIVVLALACLCQIVALVLSQSRGPFLGLVAGCYVVVLFVLMVVRDRAPSQSAESRATGWTRWTVPAMLGLALLSLVLLIASNTGQTPLSRLADVPYLGRLSSVLDPGSRTIRVRLLIWQGVAGLLSSDEPIIQPGGGPDPLHRHRRLVGYGPDTFGLAINRHIPPQLGQVEKRSKTPDRAHNDTLDRLVMNGVLGALLWLAIYVTLFSLALRSLGLVGGRRDDVALWAVLSVGAMLGAAAPWMVSGGFTLSGVGLPVGLVASLAVYLTARVMVARDRPSPDLFDWRVQGTALALMATVVGHVVEIHVGIAITSTRLYFWVFAAALLVGAAGRLEMGGGAAVQRGRPGHLSHSHHPRSAELVPVLLALGLCLPWLHALTLGSRDARTLVPILYRSWWNGAAGLNGGGAPTVLFWVVAATLVLSAVLSCRLEDTGPVKGRFRFVTGVVVAIGIGAVLQAAQVARNIPRGKGGTDIANAAEAAAGQYGVLTWVVLLLAIAVGVAICRSGSADSGMSRRRLVVTSAVALVFCLVSTVVVQRYNIDPIRADGLLKSANALAKKGQTEQALELLDRSCELDSTEPMLQLFRGRTAMAAAAATHSDSRRTAHYDLAESSLERAQELAPLDPDHRANLGRYRATRARGESDSAARRRHLVRAIGNYEAALRLRPSSVVFLNEYGRLLMNMGQRDRARQVLERAIVLDPLFQEPAAALAVLDGMEKNDSVRP